MPDVAQQHRLQAEGISLGVAVITVSDTRTLHTDRSGSLACRLLREQGHQVIAYQIVPDEPQALHAAIAAALRLPEAQALLLSGGTGPAPRDRTCEVLQAWMERELPGFGELFRHLSLGQVGSAALLSRAVGGMGVGRLLFALPGSPAAVELALRELILPELPHLWRLLHR